MCLLVSLFFFFFLSLFSSSFLSCLCPFYLSFSDTHVALLLLLSSFSNDLLQCSIIFYSYGYRHGACMTGLRLGFCSICSTSDYVADLEEY